MTRSCASVALGRVGGRRRILRLLPGDEHLPVRVRRLEQALPELGLEQAREPLDRPRPGSRFSSVDAGGLMRGEAVAQRAADRDRRDRDPRGPRGIAPPRPAQAGAGQRGVADEPAHELGDVRGCGRHSAAATTQISWPLVIPCPDAIAELGDDAVARRGDLVLHLHRLDDADHLTDGDRISVRDEDLEHGALHRARDGAVAGRRRRRRCVRGGGARAPPTAARSCAGARRRSGRRPRRRRRARASSRRPRPPAILVVR